MTMTLSFFLMRARMASEHLGRQREDLHELLGAQLARHRPEDARADRLALIVDQHRRVAVELDIGAVGAADFLGGAHDHGFHDVALLHLGVRARLLDRDDDDVAERGVLAARAAEYLDAQHPPRARVIGDVQHGLRLHHGSARLLHDAAHPPALVLAEWAGLGNQDAITDAAAVVLIVRFVFGAALHVLLVLRMLDHALDDDHDGLVHLVAHHDAFPHFHSAAHGRSYSRPAARVRSAWMVLMRAMSRRVWIIAAGLFSRS